MTPDQSPAGHANEKDADLALAITICHFLEKRSDDYNTETAAVIQSAILWHRLKTTGIADPASALEKARQVLKDLVEIVDSVPESRLLALDIDPHPPSSLSVLADEARELISLLTPATEKEV